MARKHDHGHTHDHGHAVDQSPPVETVERDLDAAGKSLSDALRISFGILKVIMIILVVAFLVSGFKTVGPDEKALVLRFGKIKGVGEGMILNPGAHWVFPYPIDELVKIPVGKNVSLPINAFWYKETREDILGEGPRPRRYVPEKLDPLTEGYCLTGSQRPTSRASAGEASAQAGASGEQPAWAGDRSDYNIVHAKWQIDYRIDNVEQFFRNVYVEDVLPGQIYFEVMTESITPLLRSVVEDAVVDAMVRYSIDEVLLTHDTIRRQVMRLVQDKLDEMETGVRVTSVKLVDVTWPKQVNEAFDAYIQASQTSNQKVSEARTYAENTLTRTGGSVGETLYKATMGEDANDARFEALWAQVAGDAQDTIAQAQAYQTKVVETAKANANYLQSILPGYRQRPELVLQQIYLDTIERVLENADEKFILDRSGNVKEQEFRIMVNRDPKLKPKGNQNQQQQQQ